MTIMELHGKCVKGGQWASGIKGAYNGGTIKHQIPFFQKAGVPIDGLYHGTINVLFDTPVSIADYDYIVPDVNWANGMVETFYLKECIVVFNGIEYKGFIYKPNLSVHNNKMQQLELLMPYIDGMDYGAELTLIFNESLSGSQN